MCQHKSIAVTAAKSNSNRAQKKTSTKNFFVYVFVVCWMFSLDEARKKRKRKINTRNEMYNGRDWNDDEERKKNNVR